MNSKIRDNNTDFCFGRYSSLKPLTSATGFFEDLCTVAEIKAMAQRIVVAKMLSDKKVYSDIVAATGASTATISRVKPFIDIRLRRVQDGVFPDGGEP